MAGRTEDISVTTKNVDETISIIGARILSFILPNSGNKPRYFRDVEGYEVEVFTQPQNGSGTSRQFRVLVYIQCKIIFKDKFTLDASVQSEVNFKMLDESGKIDKFKLSEQDPNIVMSVVSIAYSTTRGLIAERAKGTILEGAILPIMTPSNLMALPPYELSGESETSIESEAENE